MIRKPEDILAFWFDPKHADSLFSKDTAFDEQIHQEFFDTWQAACEGLLFEWRTSLKGRLAEIIVLDQFSRNLMRGDKRAFSQDSMALVLAQELLNKSGFEEGLSQDEKQFAYMPFMHSESAGIHEIALNLFEKLGNEHSLKFEILHKDIINRFDRYPHRNHILGRTSTNEELIFLKTPNSSF